LAEIDALRGASTRIDNIRGAARAALEALDYDEAMRLLESARTIIREQLQEPIELNARLSERQAEIALIRGDTQTASSLLCAAADSFAALDPVVSARKRCGYASILYDHGYRYGGSGLADAIKLWRAARETLTEADHPLDWAQTAQNLAIALRNRGDRTQGPASTTLLAEAVTCYRDALRVRTEADHPLEWATTTQNLANALAIQGERTQGPAGTALLADAVTCYRDALRVRTEAGHPLEWALATQNLANALLAQGERIQGPAGTTLLTDAVTCYRDVLRVLTEADHPLEWAITTENLARAEKALADREGTDDPAPHLRAALGHAAEDYSQEEFSFEKLKEIASERQGAGLGSEEEKAARGAVLTQIAALKDDLPKPASHGGIGHNRPPKEFELQGKELEEVAESIETIETELLSKEPNVEVVAQKTSLLTKAAGWVAGKIDTTVDAFCKSFGATLGTGTAAAVFALPYWGTLAVLLGKLKEWLILALAL
jgi:tetratricopeptide (TPR) repeat protein